MSDIKRTIYAHRQSVRAMWSPFLVGLPFFWLVIYYFCKTIGPAADSFLYAATGFIAVVACLCIVGVVVGGSQYIEVNSADIHWCGNGCPETRIPHKDINSFMVTSQGDSQSIVLDLKTGGSVKVPNIGNQTAIRNALITKVRLGGNHDC